MTTKTVAVCKATVTNNLTNLNSALTTGFRVKIRYDEQKTAEIVSDTDFNFHFATVNVEDIPSLFSNIKFSKFEKWDCYSLKDIN